MSHSDYAIGEWYTGHRRIEGDELALYEARAAAREIVVDEPIGARQPVTLTVVREGTTKQCSMCNAEFTTTAPKRDTRCPDCRTGVERAAECEWCGDRFTFRVVGGKPMNRFCSKSCAAKASRAKEKETA